MTRDDSDRQRREDTVQHWAREVRNMTMFIKRISDQVGQEYFRDFGGSLRKAITELNEALDQLDRKL